jgi:hypothetical protein
MTVGPGTVLGIDGSGAGDGEGCDAGEKDFLHANLH